VGFFAAVSFGFLPAIGISISFWPAEALRGFLTDFLRGLRLGRSAPDAPPQRFHQINDVLAARLLLPHDRLAGALLVDQLDERCFGKWTDCLAQTAHVQKSALRYNSYTPPTVFLMAWFG